MKKWVQRLFTTSTSAKSNPVNNKPSSPENETITDREPIDGTPMWIQRISQGWFLSLKGYKLSPYFKTKDEALKYMWLENHGWNVIANMIIIIHEQVANEAAKLFEQRQNNTTAAKSYINRDTGDAESQWPEESFPTKPSTQNGKYHKQ